MTDHYYTARPGSGHDESVITAQLRGMEFRFVTDTSVFSRGRVDFGSTFLIEVMQLGPAETILDLGCGYGPIGIAAAHLSPRGKVYLVDVNERATALAERNLVGNGVANAEVRVGLSTEPVADIQFDTILTNPPIRAGKQTMYQMIDDARDALRSGGTLWVVIQTKQGAPSMKKRLMESFGNVQDVDREAGYHVFRSRKT